MICNIPIDISNIDGKSAMLPGTQSDEYQSSAGSIEDSDKDYNDFRNPLKQKLIVSNKNQIEHKKKVLKVLQKMYNQTMRSYNPKVRKELLKMLAGEMKVKEKEIARMEHVPVDSASNLNFTHETMKKWMK